MEKMSFFDKDVNAATQDILDKTGKTAAFGIDLGTTNSAIALVPSGTKPKIVPLKHGTTMPSCIMWTGKDKEFIVGKDAYEHRYESSCIYSVKRHMPEVDCHLTMTVGDKELTMTPAEISAEILKGLVKETKDLYGEVKDVVVTVPAKFNEIARQHTREACELAGLNLLGIIAEPTAASMCYDIEPDKGRTQDILVYDLGGGTFDVSLVRISAGDDMSKLYDVYGIPNSLRKADDSKIIRAIDGDGDPVLGGDDIDHDTYEVNLTKLDAFGDVKSSENRVETVPEIHNDTQLVNFSMELVNYDFHASLQEEDQELHGLESCFFRFMKKQDYKVIDNTLNPVVDTWNANFDEKVTDEESAYRKWLELSYNLLIDDVPMLNDCDEEFLSIISLPYRDISPEEVLKFKEVYKQPWCDRDLLQYAYTSDICLMLCSYLEQGYDKDMIVEYSGSVCKLESFLALKLNGVFDKETFDSVSANTDNLKAYTQICLSPDSSKYLFLNEHPDFARIV